MPTEGLEERVILVVDDERSILDALSTSLSRQGYEVTFCSDGSSALESFRKLRHPMVLTDIKMPGITGEELLMQIKEIDPTTAVVMMTGYGTIDSAVTTIKAGAYDYIVKPFRIEELLHVLEKAWSHRSLVREKLRLQENSLHVLRAMVNVLEQRDAYTAGHSQRVTEIALAIAGELGRPREERAVLELAGPIHDIGKIGIEDHILRKPAGLSEEEYNLIKTHPEKGQQIIEPLDFLKDTIPIILHHHEHFDGQGYPAGLAGEDIPVGARIITVADSYDAMTSQRAYRRAMSHRDASDELERCCNTQFDPEIVDAFLAAAPFDKGSPVSGGGTATLARR